MMRRIEVRFALTWTASSVQCLVHEDRMLTQQMEARALSGQPLCGQ